MGLRLAALAQSLLRMSGDLIVQHASNGLPLVSLMNTNATTAETAVKKAGYQRLA